MQFTTYNNDQFDQIIDTSTSNGYLNNVELLDFLDFRQQQPSISIPGEEGDNEFQFNYETLLNDASLPPLTFSPSSASIQSINTPIDDEFASTNATIHLNDLFKSNNKYSNYNFNSPILKSQSSISNTNNSLANTSINTPLITDISAEFSNNSSSEITGKLSSSPFFEEDYEESVSNNNTVINGKKISDSRLSLAQLSKFLNLDLDETSKREKNILDLLKNELNFPIGEKTWIRDTPLSEREKIISNLTNLVESRYNYNFSGKVISIIIRRASYYLMQGRLRRERRLQRKRMKLQKQKDANTSN